MPSLQFFALYARFHLKSFSLKTPETALLSQTYSYLYYFHTAAVPGVALRCFLRASLLVYESCPRFRITCGVMTFFLYFMGFSWGIFIGVGTGRVPGDDGSGLNLVPGDDGSGLNGLALGLLGFGLLGFVGDGQRRAAPYAVRAPVPTVLQLEMDLRGHAPNDDTLDGLGGPVHAVGHAFEAGEDVRGVDADAGHHRDAVRKPNDLYFIICPRATSATRGSTEQKRKHT
mmetsp:Transcript_51723/g.117808  ORF Transcript_51723/g.117808 Transcript_51723/m.117808 type:complete len:229 (-) Transcript_51723:652-1338(-)